MANISSSYSYLQTSNSRITGLASGMDTESMVEKLMKAESIQMEKLQQQKQIYEWKRDTYRDINKKLSTFSDSLFDKYALQKNFSSKTVSVSDSSKLSVTAGATATGTLSVQNVTELASSATTKASLQGNLTLENFGFTGGPGSTATFKVDGSDVTITYSKTDTLNQLIGKLNDNGLNAEIKNGKISLGVDNVSVGSATNFFKKLGFDLGSTPTTDTIVPGESNEIAATTGIPIIQDATTVTLKDIGLSTSPDDMVNTVKLKVLQSDGTLKETAIEYKSTDTLDSFMKNLNSSGAGVTVLFSKGELSLTANATGNIVGGAIQVSEDSQGLFQKFGFLSGATGEIANGKNAKYTVNGLEMESNSNTLSISGYSITLKEKFGNLSTPVTISSTTDIDAMVGKIKEFVTTYNDLITSLNEKVSETKYRDYQPLTDAQRNELTEDQIKKWEEKSKSGIIRNDSTVKKALFNLRNALYQSVEGIDQKYNALYEIGITTTKTYNDGGKIEISDEDKLREALTKDPDSVIKLFTLNDKSDNENTDANNDGNPNTGMGIIAQLRKVAENTVKAIEVTAGKSTSTESAYTLGKQLININKHIDDWKERLINIENRYWKQFSAMEDAIQRANSQSAYFMSM
ncbi:flagellar filament capping protein FliD [Ureibacillus sp. NPDC094379]